LKLLLTDSANIFGKALEHELERESLRLLQPAVDEVDWRDAEAVADFVRRSRPNIVVNTLGWADSPEAVELELLPLAAGHIAAACAKRKTPMIQLSSYRVFGSDNKSVHHEDDPPAPISPAGEAFWAAEQAVAAAHVHHINLRFSWVIGSHGKNLLSGLLAQLAAGEPWVVNRRLRGAPTALSDACRVTVALAKQIVCGADNWGVLQYCSADAVTELEFAEHLAETLRQQAYAGSEPVFEITDTLPTQVPVSAVLSQSRIREDFGVQARTWRTSLVPMVKQWLHASREG